MFIKTVLYIIMIFSSVLTAINSYGLGVTDTRFNWDKKRLSVCFASGSTNDQLIVKEAVEATWRENSGVNLDGWDICQGKNSDIRILMYDHSGSQLWPRSNVGNGSLSGISKKSYGGDDATYNKYQHIKPSMFLPSTGFCSSFNDRECLKIVAVHEFGHALGLLHEQDRSDTPSWCDKKLHNDVDWDARQAVTTQFLTATWDSDSVMNYCSSKWSNNGNLTQFDIHSIQMLFGSPNHRFIKNGNNGTVSCRAC